MLQLLLLFIYSLMSVDTVFHLYRTDRSRLIDDLQYDCLYYYVNDEEIEHLFERPSWFGPVYQLIPYCAQIEPSDMVARHNITGIKFVELKQQNITSEQLYRWSTPIDVVEQYQAYLESTVATSEENVVFKNCSALRFGSACQYSFLLLLSFSSYVQQVFKRKGDLDYDDDPVKYTIYSCYNHLECTRGLVMACLDWREICDGKIDCLNGGQDEQNCFELEVNECEENEFRCYNGAQCIPLGMIDDNKLNPDCLDGTDERLVPAFLWEQCVTDPAFRCEERKCTTQLQNSCGDGACRDGSFLQTSNLFSSDECLNGRDRAILTEVLSRQANPLLSDDCWAVRWCLIPQQACAGHFCPDDSISCGELIRRSCSLPYFVYPALAAELLGNVDLVVKTNISNMHRVELFTFACFKNNLCDGRLPLLTEQIGNWSTCIQLDILKYYFVERSTNWMASLRTLLGICESRDSTALNRTHCRSDHHFHCPNNGKCISKHRLFDGNTDCFDEIDEKVGATCFYVKNSVRVECSRTISSYRNRCLLITDTIDGSFTCLYNQDKTDEIHEKRNQQPPFPLLCDMHANVIALEGNETDETNCMYWPCDNIYTRCDHIWHCSNGTDEAYCGSSICPPATHPCLSPITNELNCLPISRANDGIIDCRGASDERDLCRRQAPFDRKRRYRCWNDTECISVKELCDNYTYLSGIEGEGYQCERFHDDEQFCEDFSAMYMPYGICESYHDMNRTVKQAVLCNLSEELPQAEHYGLSPERPFTLSGRQYTVIPHLSTPSVKYKQNDLSIKSVIPLSTAVKCNRGISISRNINPICFCPPTYYGHRCQHQNQRVSLTLQFYQILGQLELHKKVFSVFILLIDDHNDIQSHVQFDYIPIYHCFMKFNHYLTYRTRPKNMTRNYSVIIHAYNKNDLTYHASWFLPVLFPFLPVNRIATILNISSEILSKCDHFCGSHGHCRTYVNAPAKFFCQCDQGWTNPSCNETLISDCSTNSISVIHRSICLCPIGKFGPRCYLTRSSCRRDTCSYHGLCIPMDERVSEQGFICICNEQYFGLRCEHSVLRIDITFSHMSIPTGILLHFIEATGETAHKRITTMKKISFGQEIATVYTSVRFHLLFTQIENNYYLTILRENISLIPIKTQISHSQQCMAVIELLNSTVYSYGIMRRVKYYHLICQTYIQLACFRDEFQICLCTEERHANCLSFDHNMSYDCSRQNDCKNDAQCFQDDPFCPRRSACFCKECFYGTECQFSTSDAILSLDIILGYHIQPNTPFSLQNLALKISIIIIFLVVLIGIITSILSILTFRVQSTRNPGCVAYLLASSVISLLTMIMLAIKLSLLLISQMGIFINQFVLLVQCVSLDFILRSLLSTSDWLYACVSTERAITVLLGMRFDTKKSRQVAKWIIVIIIIVNIMSIIYDPFYRHLADDVQEQRTWCIAQYSSYVRTFHSFIVLFHFLVPFVINFICALVIIIVVARHRSVVRQQKSYKEHLQEQFYHYKHLLITPCAMILLALPRLIISFASGCMKSTRYSWLYLVGYLTSFIPPILLFMLLVLPSKNYSHTLLSFLKNCKAVSPVR